MQKSLPRVLSPPFEIESPRGDFVSKRNRSCQLKISPIYETMSPPLTKNRYRLQTLSTSGTILPIIDVKLIRSQAGRV